MRNPAGLARAILAVAWLSGCVSTAATGPPAGTELDLGSYAVTVPAGDWQTSVDEPRSAVTFTKSRSFLGKVVATTVMKVFRNAVVARESAPDPARTADDWFAGEERNMIAEGVKTGQYQLTEVERSTTTTGGLPLYAMSYRISPPDGVHRWEGLALQRAALYLHFPPDFSATPDFYMFLIVQAGVNVLHASDDLTPIDPVIASFRVKRTTSEPAR